MSWNFINGWNMKRSRVKANLWAIVLLILAQQVMASEGQTEQPEMELLEFLGSAELIDGKWLDPLDMLQLQQAELQGGQQKERDNE